MVELIQGKVCFILFLSIYQSVKIQIYKTTNVVISNLNGEVIKVPKNIYYIHETAHKSINSTSLDVPFKLGLNIVNFSFSQQSEPSQITHIPPKTPEIKLSKQSSDAMTDEDAQNTPYMNLIQIVV